MEEIQARLDAADSLALEGRWREAAEAYAAIVHAGVSDYRLHYNFGTALMQCDRYKDGREQFLAALGHIPDSLEALNNLAGAHLKLGCPSESEEACRRLLDRQPEYPTAWSNLGAALAAQGRITEGLEAMQRALDLDPSNVVSRDNYLLTLNYLATDARKLGEAHRLLCSRIPAGPRKPLPDPAGRRIRIGYVSSDFRGHSVAYFMAGVIGTHDRNAFEVFCYSTTHAPDWMTKNFIRMAEHFVDLAGRDDHAAAARIEADGIDILVDLGGHTSGNRLGIFAHRPAPVQATYLGYPATTGCAFMDYRLVDAITDPPGSESSATEKLVRLPAPFLAYYPHPDSPPPAPPPALANGHVTYGSFNNAIKISDETIHLWSQVLNADPGARLLLKSKQFSGEGVVEACRARFAEQGVAPTRIDFEGPTHGAREHLASYGKIDIALDTFPYHGTTTTCEALWMGVPVVTLVGELHAARVGCTILRAVGLDALATPTPEGFVAMALALPEDFSRLSELRRNLRTRLECSPLFDRFRLTRGLEQAYRRMLLSPWEA